MDNILIFHLILSSMSAEHKKKSIHKKKNIYVIHCTWMCRINRNSGDESSFRQELQSCESNKLYKQFKQTASTCNAYFGQTKAMLSFAPNKLL